MGGRGSSSRISSIGSKEPQALIITTNDGVKLEYRKQSNGFVTDMRGTDVKDLNGRTFSDIKKHAQQQGWNIKEYSTKDLKQWDENRKADRETTDKFLNAADASMKIKGFRTAKNKRRARKGAP